MFHNVSLQLLASQTFCQRNHPDKLDRITRVVRHAMRIVRYLKKHLPQIVQ